MSIIIGADIVPTQSNYDLFARGDTAELIGEGLTELLARADFTIFNLEVPLTDTAQPIDKCGPNLIAPVNTITGLRAINPHFFTLSNNHILDQDEQGLYSTLRILDENNIAHAGAGKNPADAAAPYIFELHGHKIGIYCCAEHEFTIVSDKRAGANPFDPLESLDHIKELKEKADYVVVLHHGGKEHYRYPSPYLQKVCRKMTEKGADLVICQHTHCVGCEERHAGGVIVYGQGNFLFDHSDSEYWQTSLLIHLNEAMEISYIPVVKRGHTVRLAGGDDARGILGQFERRSEEIKQDGFVERQYGIFTAGMIDYYMRALCGITDLKNAKKDRLLMIQNYINCEAHKEIIEFALKS
jgi:poly-gamma-glutamate capsule biosynthesis protein CapA/YwtB (metallophosphatase superfamily)